MTQTFSLQTATIAALAVLIGAIIGFLGNFTVARRNLKKEISLKMAEYRLQWINDLGDEFAKFSSASISFLTTDVEKYEDVKMSLFQEQHRCMAKVRLLMNTKDVDYDKLIQKMTKITNLSGFSSLSQIEKTDAYAKMNQEEGEFIVICNLILKREWRKLKKNLREDTLEVSALQSDESASNSVSKYIYHD